MAVTPHRILLSAKAEREAAEDLGWVRADILLQLQELGLDDFLRAETSTLHGADRIWVFCPVIDDGLAECRLWIRVLERQGFLVVSFHRA